MLAANRVITVGALSRAQVVARHLDGGTGTFSHGSSRGFHTITGTYKGVPVSIVSIGMVRCDDLVNYNLNNLF